jgi:hypothetical protein
MVGGTVFFRTDKQLVALEVLYQKSKTDFESTETDRMNKVLDSFSAYKKIEIAFVIAGVLLIILAPSQEFWLGLGVGMLLQCALMLTADIFAERRVESYQTAISSQL